MTIESTVTKIMWALGNFKNDFETIREKFYRQINYDTIYNDN